MQIVEEFEQEVEEIEELIRSFNFNNQNTEYFYVIREKILILNGKYRNVDKTVESLDSSWISTFKLNLDKTEKFIYEQIDNIDPLILQQEYQRINKLIVNLSKKYYICPGYSDSIASSLENHLMNNHKLIIASYLK